MFNDLQQNDSLLSLNLAGNQLGIRSIDKLAEFLSEDSITKIKELDISCNVFLDEETEEPIKSDVIAAFEFLRDVL